MNPNTTYYIKGRTVTTSGISDDSNIVSVTTTTSLDNLNITSLPLPPIVNKLSILNNSAIFSIENYDLPTFNFYKITVSEFSDFSTTVYNELVIEKNKEFKLTLDFNTLYYYKLATYNVLGKSVDVTGSFTTAGELEPPTLRGVTDLTAINAKFYWSKTYNATNYRFDLALDSAFTNLIINQQTLGDVNFHNLNTLTQNTTYYLRIKSIDGSRESVFSNTISFTTLNGIETNDDFKYINLNVINLSTTYITSTEGLFYWDDSFDNYFYEVSDVANFSNILESGNLKTNSLHLTNLSSETIYYVRVKGFIDDSESLYSTVNFTTYSTNITLSVPVILSTNNVTASSFFVFWQKRNYASKYRLDISKSNTFTTYARHYLSDVDRFNLCNLESNTIYYLRLYGITDTNRQISPSSTTFSTTTLSNPPTIILSDPELLEQNQVALRWITDEDYETYEITIFSYDGGILGFYNNYNLGFTDNHTVRYFLISGKTYTYRIRGITSTGNFTEALDDFSVPSNPPEIALSSNGLDVTWEGSADTVELAYDSDFINLEKGYPQSLLHSNFTTLPNTARYARLYENDGYKSRVLKLDNVKWVRTISKTIDSIELEWNDLYAEYFVQVIDVLTSVVLSDYIIPKSTTNNNFVVTNLEKNKEYRFNIFTYDSNEKIEYNQYRDRTKIHEETDYTTPQNDTLSSIYATLTGATVNALGIELSNLKDYYDIEYSDNVDFLWSETISEATGKLVINELKEGTQYNVKVISILGNYRNTYPAIYTATTDTFSTVDDISNITPVLANPVFTNGGYSFNMTFTGTNTDFRVEISNLPTFNVLDNFVNVVKNSNKKFTLFNLGKVNYYFRVVCNNSEYISKYSNIINLDLT